MDIENQEVAQEPSLRDTLEANFEAAEKAIEPQQEVQTAEQRARDEHGRFAKTDKQPEQQVAVQQPEQVEAQPAEQMTKKELTTWKREMRPLHEKLGRGEALTPDEALKLHQYNVERETNYATGISAYKAQAEQAKQFTEAMTEFMPILQQNNIEPSQWIQNLGRAHQTLAMGSPEQKLQMFQRLAQDYGVPLGMVQQAQQGQIDPTMLQMMQEIQQLKQGINGVTSWRQQQENQVAQQQIAKFADASKFPHFERVRPVMAQLLDAGLADDPDSAYEKAVRLDGDAWQAEQQRQAAQQLQQQSTNKAAAAAKARQAAVSVRTGTPAGYNSNPNPSNLRGAIEAAFDQVSTGGRV
jgi:hypothetical protein